MQQHNALNVSSLSGANLGKEFSSVHGGGVYITFQWDMVKLKYVDPEKNGKTQRRLRLTKQPIGDPSTAATSYITEDEARQNFPAEWEYFTKHGDMPETGTPLSELPGISVSQMQIMQIAGLRSIEDVLGVGEEIINRVGHEGRMVRSVAEAWKKNADEHSDMINFAEAKANSEAAIAAAKQRAERAEASSREMAARLEALMAAGNGGQAIAGGMEQPIGRDEGPSIDDTPNPLADGPAEINDDDPLA